MKLDVTENVFALKDVFTISRGSRTHARVVTVKLTDGDLMGWGECVPYARYGETVEGVIAEIRHLADAIASGGIDRQSLQERLPAGAARNALDCAFWDLEAKRAGRPVHELAGLPAPTALQTAYTLSLAEPEKMRRKAEENAARPLLKLKLGGENDIARLEAVRAGAPQAAIIVDANEGWTAELYSEIAPYLLKLGVAMVEQPLPAGQDAMLGEIERPLPVCADESCHDRASLAELEGRYDMVNIKLDKTGGLTEALGLREDARAQGFSLMVGCMVGSSLAMAPALLVAQGAELVDLDGPLLLAKDRAHAMHYEGSMVWAAPPALWG
ncbi:dipeptide epimerase [Georhizobium profundi]|uniref:Dipeptide epimerase n=1 Tax=Georhizobium profundi TaxID=2341112 RepID=A0A3S9BA37_9HYPH|nr:dipeptide epimerase [Georhizobium profundi]